MHASAARLPRRPVSVRLLSSADLPMLAILFGLLMLAGLVLTRLSIAGFEMFVRDAGMSANPEPVEVQVADVVLAVPQNMIRFGSERGGRVRKLDLHVHWPSLEGFTVDRAAAFQSVAASTPILYVTIRPASGPMSPEQRFQRVYPRVIAAGMRKTADGYVVRSFRAGHGYDGEELYIAPDPAMPLVARCEVEGTAASCIAEFRTDRGLEVSYRFPRMLLGDWRQVDEALRSLATGL